MKTRTIVMVFLSIFALLFLTQCSSSQTTSAAPTGTSLPATPTSAPATPTSVPPTPTPEPPTPTPAPATSTSTVPPPASTVPDGINLVQERCTNCHSIERIQNASKTRDEWENTVKRMIAKGTVLNSDEKDAVINYLAETYKK